MGGATETTSRVEKYLPMVKRCAFLMAPRFGSEVGYDDLYGYGCVGLVKADRDYDESFGASFGTYARKRIVGEMLDGRRELDPLTRNQRKAGMKSPASFEVLRANDKTSNSFETSYVGDSSGMMAQILEQSREADPALQWDESDAWDELLSVIPSGQHREAASYFFRFGLNSVDAGRAMGIGPSRFSQIIRPAMRILARSLRDRGRAPAGLPVRGVLRQTGNLRKEVA